MTINLLPDEIINQIAAGEVIENPSAVIKELVENSIDAGASVIDIDIEDYGLKRIKIKDNGCGISKADLLRAPLRHATSKIKDFNDLYSIKTMGFRGEALASIFSIAKTKIISMTEDSECFEVSSQNISCVKESAGQVGTTIIIEDLFYNTPARKKYLKSGNLELKAILDVLKRFELSYYNIKLSLKHNGKLLINKPAFKSQEENIYYVLGKDLRGKLVAVDENTIRDLNGSVDGIKLKGFIGNPAEVTYGFRKNQMLFVNKRFVKSKLIRDAIYEGFTSNLMKGRHPFFVLFIEIDPEIIDVNIHPQKIELKFENELEVFEFIRSSVKSIFEKNTLFKKFNEEEGEGDDIIESNKKLPEILDDVVEDFGMSSGSIKNNADKENKYFTPEVQRSFELKEAEIKYEMSSSVSDLDSDSLSSNSGDLGLETENGKCEDYLEVEVPKEVRGPLYDELAEFRLVGQMDKTYILIATKSDMILVDQHVAEEKYFYEKFKKELGGQKASVQKLLKSQVIHLDNSEMLMYEENKSVLDSIGFETEVFGANEIIVRAVPLNMRNKIEDADKLKDFLYDILVNKRIKCVDEEKHSKIASMACRTAVMAGDELTMPQMRKMVENLRGLEQPFNCPHGRPTFLKYSFKDLEKKFKRVL